MSHRCGRLPLIWTTPPAISASTTDSVEAKFRASVEAERYQGRRAGPQVCRGLEEGERRARREAHPRFRPRLNFPMRSKPRCRLNERRTARAHSFPLMLLLAALWTSAAASALHAQQPKSTKQPRQLDRGIRWQRDPATGELTTIAAAVSPNGSKGGDAAPGAPPMQVITQMVPVTCIVSAADGSALPGLAPRRFPRFRRRRLAADCLLRRFHSARERRAGH